MKLKSAVSVLGLNENDEVDSHEGVENVTVTIVGGDVDEEISTDADGVWTIYVPIRSSFNVTVAKDGFSTEYYDMNTAHQATLSRMFQFQKTLN